MDKDVRDEQRKCICDHEGWSLGIKAALRGLFGTDTEMRIKHGGIHEDIEHAKSEVGRMSAGAEGLLEAINSHNKKPIDEAEAAFEAIVRDL